MSFIYIHSVQTGQLSNSFSCFNLNCLLKVNECWRKEKCNQAGQKNKNMLQLKQQKQNKAIDHADWSTRSARLSASKTSLVRNESNWCKSTELLQSFVFTRGPLQFNKTSGEGNKSLKVERRELDRHPLWCQAVHRVLVSKTKSSLFPSNVETMEDFYNWTKFMVCEEPSVWYYAATLSFWKNKKN